MTTAEGGMISLDDSRLAEGLRAFRHAGEVWRRTGRSTVGDWQGSLEEAIGGMSYRFAGHNFRMNALQAAIGRAQLKKLDQLNARRNKIAGKLSRSIREVAGLDTLDLPLAGGYVANRFVLLINDSFPLSRRATVFLFLHEGIPAGVYYPRLHASSAVSQRKQEEIYPNAWRVVSRHVLLPCYPAMGDTEVSDVSESIEKLVGWEPSRAEVEELERAARECRVRYFGQFLTLVR